MARNAAVDEAQARPPRRRVEAGFSDLSSRAQIREIALQLFAERGVRETSIRMVASAAGLSPGAVVHHFPTKRALEEAVHTDVIERVVAAVHGVGLDTDPINALARRHEAYDTLLRDQPYIADYIRRMLTDDSDESLEFFRSSLSAIESEMRDRVEAGLARELSDPELGLALYWIVVNARFLLRPHLEKVLGLDLQNPEDVQRLHRAETELLTRPVFPLDPTSGSDGTRAGA